LHFFDLLSDAFFARGPVPPSRNRACFIFTAIILHCRINSGIELMRQELGVYFPSEKVLEVNLFIQLSNLNDKWMRSPVPTLRANSYRIRQLMALRYNLEEVL